MKKIITHIFILISFGVYAQKSIRNKSKMCEKLTEMRNNDQLYRKGDILGSLIHNDDRYPKREVDSVWALQLKIDDANTEELIKLTKKHGWISDERIDCSKLNIWLIFRHSQEEYFEQISELIEKEHNSNRLKDSHYIYIKNHLEVRPPIGN